MYSELPSKEDLEKEYRKILVFMEGCKKGQLTDLKSILETNRHFFAMLQSVLEKGAEGEKKEAALLFKEVLLFFENEAKRGL